MPHSIDAKDMHKHQGVPIEADPRDDEITRLTARLAELEEALEDIRTAAETQRDAILIADAALTQPAKENPNG